jgi:hypothetical protein
MIGYGMCASARSPSLGEGQQAYKLSIIGIDAPNGVDVIKSLCSSTSKPAA